MNINCIVIDDEPLALELIASHVSKVSYLQLRGSFHRAVDAVRVLHEEKIDLIFLDINMPGIDGWEFLEEYKRLDPEQQAKAIVVMLTSSDNPADIRKAKTFNVPVEFKIKPLTSEMLSEIMDKYC